MSLKVGGRTNSSRLPNLTAIRESKGITLQQIEQETKISCRFLKAIESGEFETLPGGIFNTSYIRQYARNIDYNEEDLLAEYRRMTGEVEPANPTGQVGTQERKSILKSQKFLAILKTGS